MGAKPIIDGQTLKTSQSTPFVEDAVDGLHGRARIHGHMDEPLLTALLARVKDTGAKSALQTMLADIKATQNLGRQELRTSGTLEELGAAVRIAIDRNWLTEERLASLVDEAEENGGQHIFMFRVTDAGVAAVRAATLRASFPNAPMRPTPALYAELPQATRTFFQERQTALVVKQIYRADYWEKDETKSYSNANERGSITVRHERRAVNLFAFKPEERLAEFRIDRVHAQDETFAVENFQAFAADLEPTVDWQTHLEPIPIWEGFSQIVADRDRTYMSTDEGEDATVGIRIKNRRLGALGVDVRDQPKYPEGVLARRTLNVYWVQEDGSRIHTILSKVRIGELQNGVDVAKVYIAAKLDQNTLEGLLATIRSFVP
jgi:hypothetical protein